MGREFPQVGECSAAERRLAIVVHGARFGIERTVSGSQRSCYPVHFVFAQEASADAVQDAIKGFRHSFSPSERWLTFIEHRIRGEFPLVEDG